ncbi:hypothetical protein [Candidatus Paracaedibacter symbiosus]|uniref:hypothetical protein n=1 Tax=Candidatus Paracaedibacter symbiosus TaxID=244582 RepID=UPI000509CA1B|nr:hypothetical protein [Candidatus Paracaedibacter symbiosus]
MNASTSVCRTTAFTLMLNLTISQLYANEKRENGHIEWGASPRHHYQFVPSEGTPSYKWVMEREKEKSFKLKYSHASLPTKFDFSQDINVIHTQGNLGSCTAQTLTLSLEYYLKKFGISVELSPLFVYFNERKLNGTINEDCGASLTDAIRAVYKYGACLEQSWTYTDDETKFKITPPDNTYSEARSLFRGIRLIHTNIPHQLQNIKQSLADKTPVFCGINVFPSFEHQETKKQGSSQCQQQLKNQSVPMLLLLLDTMMLPNTSNLLIHGVKNGVIMGLVIFPINISLIKILIMSDFILIPKNYGALR